ncbi:MAG: hypothetical protein IKY30_06995 [Oscillospiraceae bacterium]|nr:hypothetical protein [Oscillospiraceae bacterium]
MELLYKFIGVLCLTGYISGVLGEFIPAEYTRKTIRLTVAIYIISNFFILFGNSYNLLKIQNVDSEDYSIEAENYVIESSEKELGKFIAQTLKSKKISYNRIEVHIHKQSEGLHIDSINIYGVDNTQKNMVKELLSDYGNLLFGD